MAVETAVVESSVARDELTKVEQELGGRNHGKRSRVGWSEQSQLLGVVRGVRNAVSRQARAARRGDHRRGGWACSSRSAYVDERVPTTPTPPCSSCGSCAIAAIVGMAAWFVVRPLLPKFARRPGGALSRGARAVARRRRVITAVEMQNSARAARTRAAVAGAHRPVSRAPRSSACDTPGDGKAIDAGELKTNGGILAAVLGAAMLLTMFGPPALRNGLKLVARAVARRAAATLFSIAVEPGNATVAKGGDQLIAAHLRGFQSERVELLVRPADSTTWTRLPMTADSHGVFAFRLFDIGSKTQYAVEANGVRSTTYTLDVSNLPYVKQIDLQYRYPAYTQLPPNDVDSTGDIAALKGTMVRVRVAPTVPTTGGRVVVDGGDTLKLVPTADGTLMAMLRVDKPGFYKVELQGPDGRMVTGSLDYTIDVLPDRPPTVQLHEARAATRRCSRSTRCTPRRAPRTTTASRSSTSCIR